MAVWEIADGSTTMWVMSLNGSKDKIEAMVAALEDKLTISAEVKLTPPREGGLFPFVLRLIVAQYRTLSDP